MGPDVPALPPTEIAQVVVSAAAMAQAAPITVETLKYEYTVVGNTLLDREVIETHLRQSTEPKAALDALNQAYRDAGYILVVLTARVRERNVVIQVIQGRITEEEIAPSLARYFTGLKDRPDLKLSTIVRQAVFAEAYAARQGKRPKITFDKAKAYGGSKIMITEEPIEGARDWSAALAFNNYGNRYSSSNLGLASVALRPGSGVELTADYTHGFPKLSDESRDSSYNSLTIGASVITPWGQYAASYRSTNYYIGGEAVAPFFQDGDLRLWKFDGTQLLYADGATRWSLNQSFTNTNYVVNVEVPGFSEPFRLTDQKYDAVSLGTIYSKAFQISGYGGSVIADLNASKGLSSRSGTFLPDIPGTPDPGFLRYRGNIAYNQALPKGFAAAVTLTGQSSDTTLPTQEQWVLGGFGNLSAWYSGIADFGVGDSGYLLRTTLSSPARSWGVASGKASIFIEAGSASKAFKSAGLTGTPFLSDVGLSLSATIKGRTSLSLAYAWPWETRHVDEELIRDERTGLLFNLNYTF